MREAEFNDDRLGRLLGQLGDPEIWRAIEQDLWRQTVIAYELDLERVRLDSTASFGYHETTEGGLMQFGHSKDHRPDKPQLKLMAAVAEPSAQMIASEVHPGHRADDGLYLPLIERVRPVTGRSGLLGVDDLPRVRRSRPAARFGGRDQIPYIFPLVVGQVGWVELIAHTHAVYQPTGPTAYPFSNRLLDLAKAAAWSATGQVPVRHSSSALRCFGPKLATQVRKPS